LPVQLCKAILLRKGRFVFCSGKTKPRKLLQYLNALGVNRAGQLMDQSLRSVILFQDNEAILKGSGNIVLQHLQIVP